jgi:hypothetical protein
MHHDLAAALHPYTGQYIVVGAASISSSSYKS